LNTPEVSQRAPEHLKKLKKLKNGKKNRRNKEPSVKKNSLPNLINQFRSFFENKSASHDILHRAILLLEKTVEEIEKIKNLFYRSIRVLNFQKGKTYVNENFVKIMYTAQGIEKNFPELKIIIENVDFITIK
jgi:hypothetical protein